MLFSIPAIEISNHTYALSVWRPNSERNSIDAIVSDGMRTQFLVDMFVLSFCKQMKVELTQYLWLAFR
jgi:hypothetical protein